MRKSRRPYKLSGLLQLCLELGIKPEMLQTILSQSPNGVEVLET
jgi:hypothetical protein